MMPIHGPQFTLREYACPDPACPRRAAGETQPECPVHRVLMVSGEDR